MDQFSGAGHYTGIGIGNVYRNSDPSSSKCGTSGIPTFVRISAVRQVPGPKTGATTTFPYGCIANAGPGYSNCRDSNGSGCPDKMKLSNTATQGGLRDPFNRWDYFNPEKVNTPALSDRGGCPEG